MSAELKIKLENKTYTKQELIESALKQLNLLEDGDYKYLPDDTDNFHTDYSFQKVKVCDPDLQNFEVPLLLVAIDIVNPFTNTIHMNNLEELIKRCNDYNCYDKVGDWFYDIEGVLNGEPEPDNFTDYVVEWLNYIDGLKRTKQVIGFTLELSK